MSDINIGQFSEALNDKMDIDSGNANPEVVKFTDYATNNKSGVIKISWDATTGTLNIITE